MGHGSTVRSMVALGMALSTLAVAAQPVAAARILEETGNPAYYELYDEMDGRRGANCIYETASFDLDKITIRAPQMHGNYPQDTKVQWRFKIRRQSLAPAATFSTIFTSSWQTDLANDAIPADDFTRRTWQAPESPSGRFQVLVELRFWYQGSVEGFVRAQYEWYKAKWSSDYYVNNEYCLQDY